MGAKTPRTPPAAGTTAANKPKRKRGDGTATKKHFGDMYAKSPSKFYRMVPTIAYAKEIVPTVFSTPAEPYSVSISTPIDDHERFCDMKIKAFVEHWMTARKNKTTGRTRAPKVLTGEALTERENQISRLKVKLAKFDAQVAVSKTAAPAAPTA